MIPMAWQGLFICPATLKIGKLSSYHLYIFNKDPLWHPAGDLQAGEG